MNISTERLAAGADNLRRAFIRLGEAWWRLAVGDYIASASPTGANYEGFLRWYRRVYEVAPEPPAFVAREFSPQRLKARAALTRWREEWERGEL